MDKDYIDPKSKLSAEQLKAKISTMKKEIAKKQRRLEKCKKVAKRIHRKKMEADRNTKCKSTATKSAKMPLELPESPEIGLKNKKNRSSTSLLESNESTKSESPSKSTSAKGILDATAKQSELSTKHKEKLPQDVDVCRGSAKNLSSANVASVVSPPAIGVASANISPFTVLRRSSRTPRESQVIASGDFLLGSKIRKRCASTESSEVTVPFASGLATGKKDRTIFPVFPHCQETRNGCTDFVLPSPEFANLKLQVQKTKQLLNREQLVEEDLTTKDQQTINGGDATIVRYTAEDFPLSKVGHLPGSAKRNEPIHLVHCGELTSLDAPSTILTVVITVQVHWISTWIGESSSSGKEETSTNWSLLKTSKRDLENCQQTNMHGIQTKDVVATVCILASKDKQRLTFLINTCDSRRKVTLRQIIVEPDFNVMTGSLLSSCFSISGEFTVDSSEIAVANVWARTSRLKYVSLDGRLCKIRAEDSFTEVDDNLNSLVAIQGLDRGLLGTSSSMLFIWNRTTGQIIRTIELKNAKFNCRFCVFCKGERGLLFLGLFNQTIADQCSLVVVNPNKSTWTRLSNFSSISSSSLSLSRQRRRQNKAVEQDNATSTFQARKHGKFLVNVIGSSAIYVWHLSTGKQLAHLVNGEFDAATIYQSSHKSGTRLFVANQSGNVVIYSTC